MNAVSKLSREVRRMMSERVTLLFIALAGSSAIWFSLNATGRTASDAYMVNAAQNSAFFSSLLFTLLSLIQFHRDYKNNSDAIVLTSTDVVHHQVRRTLALICVAMVTTLLISLFALPYAVSKTGDYFQIPTFITAWFLIFLNALIYTVLLSTGIYMLTKQVGVAFIIMMVLILLSKQFESMVILNPSYLFYWVQTTADNFSDLVTNWFQIDMLLWNRLFGLLVSLGVWALGLCTIRRYGRSLLGSILANCRRIGIPIFLIGTFLLSFICFKFEPLFDDSKPMDFSGAISTGTGITVQYSGTQEVGNPNLTLIEKTFALDVNAKSRSLSGVAKYKLKNATGEAQLLPVLVNTGLNLDSILINGQKGKAVRGKTGESSTVNWSIEMPPSAEYEIEIGYSGRILNDNTILQRAIYGISDGYVRLAVVGVSPSLDVNVSDDSAFSGTLMLDENLEPVFNRGKAIKSEAKGGKTQWLYTGDSGAQVTSLFAAEYMTRSFEAGELDIELKYFKKHDKSITDMDAVNVIKATIDYFTEVYGPLIYDKSLLMLELPAYVSGGFAGGNMSAMDETSFNAEGYFPSGSHLPDTNGGIDILVHEIAHQWWGLATMPTQDGVSSWSAEGITSYSTYSFLKHYLGDVYVQERFIDKWKQGWETYKNAFYIQHPEYLVKLSDTDASNIMGSFQQIRLYDVMPLILLKGEEALGGAELFQKKLSELYRTHLGQQVTYDDFLAVTGLSKEVIEHE